MGRAYSKGMIKKHSSRYIPSVNFLYIHFSVVLQEQDNHVFLKGNFPWRETEDALFFSRQRYGVADDHNFGGSIWN